MYQHVESDLLLPCNTLRNFCTIKGFVLFLRLFPFPVSRTICFDIPGLREGTDRCGRKLRQAKFRFLQFLPLAPLRQTYGILFGDAGQGLVLLIGGYLLYHFKKINLTAVLSSCGFFSTIFGLLYGSVFGFEDWIPALWLRPTEAMTNLPVIGTLNTVFVVTITIGMGLILLTMIFHMINSLREKKPGEALFDTNGLAGFVFYGAVVAVIMLFMTGHTIPAAGVLVVMFVVPLLVIVCKEPLSALVEKKKYQDENGPVMFVVQGFFELFEVCLSYFSNTLSFVRIGAFAVSHAAMMQVVMMLAGAENGQAPNVIVVIVGNLVVMGMEGLIVGIQVLRLQYYEFFSRFYKGDGRKFEPYLSREENI